MKQELWRKADDLFHAALERTPHTRQTYLDSVCGADTDLRRRVELLLAKEAQAGSSLEEPTTDNEDPSVTLTSAKSLLGQQFGPYQIVSPLGAGGMGEVYRALDARLGREVAIKISQERFSARFEREARAISSLNHPHICTLYDVGPNYLVMELVEGETLRDWLKRAPAVEPSLEIARQVLEALRAAHRAGIIHRDLKPENIMVRFDGYVKVLDFGLAKMIPTSPLLGTQATATASLSRPGQVVGTVAYMSPEQILGQDTDQRSDLFSFGIILYEMLTRQHPWPRSSSVDRLHAILHDDPHATVFDECGIGRHCAQASPQESRGAISVSRNGSRSPRQPWVFLRTCRDRRELEASNLDCRTALCFFERRRRIQGIFTGFCRCFDYHAGES